MTVQNVDLYIPGTATPWTISRAYTPDGDYANVDAMNEGIASIAQNLINKWLDLNTMSDRVNQDSVRLTQMNALVAGMKTWGGTFPSGTDLAAVAVSGFIPAGQLWVKGPNAAMVDISTIKAVPSDYPTGPTPLDLFSLYQRPDGSVFYTFPLSRVDYTEVDVTISSSNLYTGDIPTIAPLADAAYINNLVPSWQQNADTVTKNLTQVSQTNQTVLQQMMARYEMWNQGLTDLITRKENLLTTLAKNLG